MSGSQAPKACRRRGASAGRAEKRTSDAGLPIPAFAGVVRTTCEDQGRPSGEPRRRWRIPANAAGTVCGAFFELTRRPGRIAPQLRRAFGAAIRAPKDRRRGSWFGSVIEGARRDAGSARRQLEKRPAGVPDRRRRAFVPSARSTWLSNRSLTGFRITQAGAAIVRHSPKGRFSARQPEAPGPFYDAVEQPR